MANKIMFAVVSTSLMIAMSDSLAKAALQVGDRIRFTNQTGSTGGGEFGVHLKEHADPYDGTGESQELFRTFCLEKNEFIDFHVNGFVVDSISGEAVNGGVGGGNPDAISAETAWLYYNFVQGTLSGYLGTTASADDLQNALWGFEEEISQDDVWSDNPFVVAALAASGTDKAAALARTFVLNIVWATDRHGFDGMYEAPMGPLSAGDRAQSMLFVIPELSGIATWSILGLIGLTAEIRRRVRRTA